MQKELFKAFFVLIQPFKISSFIYLCYAWIGTPRIRIKVYVPPPEGQIVVTGFSLLFIKLCNVGHTGLRLFKVPSKWSPISERKRL